MSLTFDRKAFAIYNRAMCLELPAREAFIHEACLSDRALLSEVGQLLRSADAGSLGLASMLEIEINKRFLLDQPDGDGFIGTWFGSFHVLKLLGAGGMGHVYLARQESPRRQVAIKIIKPGMDSGQILKRFHQEREILARLDHPFIAKIFDAGKTGQGAPFFVMEYIEGIPVTEYCDTHCLAVEARLRLMIRICQAVQHAHQRGIIHRDLKPSNILVITMDGEPVPKIIDFGIAKAFGGPAHPVWRGPSSGAKTSLTGSHVFVGSLGYMSPEQARVKDIDVDTRTDVYTLGVLLYQLLVGVPPFHEHRVSDLSWDEMFRLIKEKAPLKPSQCLTGLGKDARPVAAARKTNPHNLKNRLCPELDWITLRALEKEKDRRYASPADLALDLENYLNRMPVCAGPPSIRYRLAKFVKRNKWMVAVAMTVLLLLSGGLAGTLHNLGKARRETAKAQKTLGLLQDLIASADPFEQGAETRVRDMLDAFADKLETSMVDNPEIRATLLFTLGRTYTKLSLYSKAHGHAEQAFSIRRRILGETHRDTMETGSLLGIILTNMGRYDEGEALQKANIQIFERVLGPDHPDTLLELHSLGTSLMNHGDYPEAERILRDVLERRQKVLGPTHEDFLESMQNLAILLSETRRLAEAETLHRRVLATLLTAGSQTSTASIKARYFLGKNLLEQQKPAEAEPVLRASWEIGKKVLGEDHQATLYAMNGLARVVSALGNHNRAVDLARRLIPLSEQRLGPNHPATILFKKNLGMILVAGGFISEGERVYRETMAAMTQVFGEGGFNTLDLRINLAIALEKQGRLQEAAVLFRRIVEEGQQALGPDHFLTQRAARALEAIQGRLHGDTDEIALSLE